MITETQRLRWKDVDALRGPCIKGHGTAAHHAMRDGASFTHIIDMDNATRDFAEADELRAPGSLTIEEMEREMGTRV